MDSTLKRIITRLDDYVAGLDDVFTVSEADKTNLKNHLLAVQNILLRNGNERLQEVVGGLSEVILRRL